MLDSSISLNGKEIVLGVTGSIAAYKACDLTSSLVKLGANVHVVMTNSAKEFVQPLTFATLSRNPVSNNLWEEGEDWHPGHIELADRADLLLIAPATANTIAKLSLGLADDLLTSLYLAFQKQVVIAPAMNGKMLHHVATESHLKTLAERGHHIVPTKEGMLACGYEGEGKLADVENIIKLVVEKLL